MKIMNWLLLAGIATLTAGCATPIAFIPDEIGSRGLVVAELCGVNPMLTPHGDPVIDGTEWMAGMTTNKLVVALSPGKHTLHGFRSLASHMDLGAIYINQYNYYTINESFSIEIGKATNLGLLVIRPKVTASPVIKRNDAVPYEFIALDNTDAMSIMLEETYPKTLASLKGISPPQLPNDSSYTSEIVRVREAVAQNKYLQQQKRHDPDAGYVTGCAGTIARLGIGQLQSGRSHQSSSSVGVVAPKVLPTPTLTDLSKCTVGRARAACLISRSKYLSIKGDTVTERALPQGMFTNSLYAFGDTGLVAVDDSMSIHTSRDDGVSWTTNSEFTFNKALERSKYLPDPKNRFGFAAGRDGYYIFGKGLIRDHTSILYADYRTGEYRNLRAPKEVHSVSTVRETDAGVYIGPREMAFANSKIYFLARGSSTWEARATPGNACIDIAFLDTTGQSLQILCSGDAAFRSADGGITWDRIFKLDSVF